MADLLSVESPAPCAEEDLYQYEVDEKEMERSFLSGGFAGELTIYDNGFCTLAIDIPDTIDHRVLKDIVPQVVTNDVKCATVICRSKIVLELRGWVQDPQVAAGVWYDRLIGLLSNADKQVLRRLKKVDEMRNNILTALAIPARPSGDSFNKTS